MRIWICLLLLFASCHKKHSSAPTPTYPVRVAMASQKEAPIFLEALGHVDSITAINIKSRIEGELTGVYFTQGQEVHKGDLLFTIDPRPYQAALKEAEATLEQNLASLALASEKVKRYRTLAKDEYYSQIDYETLQANFASTTALVEQNKAQVETALINLNYCWLYAPIDGMTGLLQVDFGNLVANDGSTLATLNQMTPIFVTFSIPEFQLPQVQRYTGSDSKVGRCQGGALVLGQAKPASKQINLKGLSMQTDPKNSGCPTPAEPIFESRAVYNHTTPLKVLAAYEDFSEETFFGELFMIDNSVDANTGMITLRAQFENGKRELWPGQFVRVRLILHTIPDAVIIPYTAIQLTQHGPVVFVVHANNTVEQRSVKLGQRENENVIILQGLKANETYVTEGQLNLFTGAQVDIQR